MPYKIYYERLKAEKRCVNCGRKLEDSRLNKTTCEDCAARHKKYVSESTSFFSEHNICPRCGINKLMDDEKNCPECRAKLWAYGINYRKEHPEYVEKKRKSDKSRRDYRIKNHLCVNCGEPLTDTRYKNCDKCRTYNMLRMRKARCESVV